MQIFSCRRFVPLIVIGMLSVISLLLLTLRPHPSQVYADERLNADKRLSTLLRPHPSQVYADERLNADKRLSTLLQSEGKVHKEYAGEELTTLLSSVEKVNQSSIELYLRINNVTEVTSCAPYAEEGKIRNLPPIGRVSFAITINSSNKTSARLLSSLSFLKLQSSGSFNFDITIFSDEELDLNALGVDIAGSDMNVTVISWDRYRPNHRSSILCRLGYRLCSSVVKLFMLLFLFA
jgi:hypothetical protein